MKASPFSPGEKILVLRLFRLGHIPPAQSAAELLAENGLPVLVVEYGNLREEETSVAGSPPRLRLASPWAKWLPRQVRALAIFLSVFIRVGRLMTNEGRPRLIYTHGLQEQALAYLFRLFFGVPFVAHVHEGYETGELTGANRLFLAVEGMALRQAVFLVFPDATRANRYRERYRINHPIFIAFNCPRLHFQGPVLDLRARLAIPADATLLLYIGGIADLNCLSEAIDAIAGVPGVHLLLVGWGEPQAIERLKARARSAAVEKRVHFLGPTDRKWEYIDNCDLAYCVYRPGAAARHACASNKLLEAVAAGLPVIVSNASDFVDFLRQYEVGIAVSEISGAGVRAALACLQSDSAARRRMSECGLEWHRTLLNYEAQFQPILQELYRIAGSAESFSGQD